MKFFRKICCILVSLAILSNIAMAATEIGSFPDVDLLAHEAIFMQGTLPLNLTVSGRTHIADSSFNFGGYTTVNSKSASSNAEFGSFDIANICASDSEEKQPIGLSEQKLDGITLKMKIKLDDVRNKNLKIYFSYAEKSGALKYDITSLRNNRFEFVDSTGNKYIDISEFVEETTDWQDIEAKIDLTDFEKVYSVADKTEIIADWSKASIIHLVSLNSDNAFSDTDLPAESIEISYGDIELSYSKAVTCEGEIMIKESASAAAGDATELNASATVYPGVKITNRTSKPQKALLMYTVYKDNEMIDIKGEYVSVKEGTDDEFFFDGGYTLPSDTSDMQITVYLWENISDVQAISHQLSIN